MKGYAARGADCQSAVLRCVFVRPLNKVKVMAIIGRQLRALISSAVLMRINPYVRN